VLKDPALGLPEEQEAPSLPLARFCRSDEYNLPLSQEDRSLQLTESKEQRPKTISLEALESLVKKYNQPLLSGGYDEYLLDKKRYLEQENQKLPSYTK
jgi:hypothetical protein